MPRASVSAMLKWVASGATDRSEKYDLMPAKVRGAVCLNTPQLVGEVFAVAKGTVAHEHARQAWLDSKANMLLAGMGVAVSVLTLALTHADSRWGRYALATAAMFALTSAAHAVIALRVRGYSRIADRSIFNADMLRKADTNVSGEAAVALYQRYLLPALWDAHVRYVRANDERATVIFRGQAIFVVALTFALVGAALLACGR